MRRALHTIAILSLAVAVLLPAGGCAARNSPPEIVSLESRERVVSPGDSVLIECIAIDADDDELSYEWSSDRGVVNGYAGTIAWTAPAQEGLARITVNVSDGAEEEMVSQSVTVVVKRNIRPMIEGVVAELDWVRPGESVSVHCAATDDDGDALTYTWTADCGVISGEGETVSWTAPETETKLECKVTVVVDDGYEGMATSSVTVVASKYEPLLVDSVTVTALEEPYYLVSRTDWHKVYWGDSYVIECAVSEPDRIVSWQWSDGGPVATFPTAAGNIAFEGSGTKIRWTAPKERGEMTLTVIARDAMGNEATKSITLQVESCTCAFPKPDVDESTEEQS